MYIKKNHNQQKVSKNGLCKLQTPRSIRQKPQVADWTHLAIPYKLLPRLEKLYQEPFRRRAHRHQGKVQHKIKENGGQSPPLLTLKDGAKAPTLWLGYKKEHALFCNTRLLSCLLFAQVPNANFDYVKKHWTFSRLSSIASLASVLSSICSLRLCLRDKRR